MNYHAINLLLIPCFLFISCQNQNPNVTNTGKDELQSLEISRPLDNDEMEFEDIIYVPIYSKIFVDQQNQNNLLAATLSIRNTSFTDSLFIKSIDYYDTHGTLVRNYISNTISLNPMATINYVIKKEEVNKGSGASFIVKLTAKSNKVKPLIQAIMVGEIDSNKGYSFSTDGYSVKID